MVNLPHEIITDIFLETIVESRNDFLDLRERHEIQRRPTDTIPFTLSHVCRIWRDLVLSFGELWSFLSFDYRRSMDLEIFKTCLRRTNGCPLDFSIWIDTIHRYPGYEDSVPAHEHLRAIEEIIDMIFSQQHRWRDVHLEFNCNLSSWTLERIRADNMPLLRSLSLSCFIYENHIPIKVDVALAKSARLRELVLEGVNPIDFGEEPIHTSTERMDLDLSSGVSDEIIHTICPNLLRTAPNLKHLRTELPHRLTEYSRTIGHETRKLLVHDLHSFVFCGRAIPFLREEISFRSLNALHFTEFDDRPRGRLLVDFVRRFTPSLTFLDIAFWIESQLLITTLCLLPTLRGLQTKFAVASEMMPFLEALTLESGNEESRDDTLPNPNDRIICPHLHSLSLNTLRGVSDDFLIALRAMLESRHRYLKTFQRLRMSRVSGDHVLHMPFTSEDRAQLERPVSGRCDLTAEGDEAERNPFAGQLYDLYWR